MQLTKTIKWNADDIETKPKKSLLEILINNLALVIMLSSIILGYIVYIARTQYLISEHKLMYTIILQRGDYTPKILAEKYIYDVSIELGAQIIKDANGLSSINQILPAGMEVKIPLK
jgi:hypothetical protein